MIIERDSHRWSVDDILEFLRAVDEDFPTPISQKVPLEDFAHKLYKRATLSTCEIDGRIAGMVAGYTNDTEGKLAYITMVATHPDYRGRGIGTKVMEAFLQACRDKGMREVNSYVVKTNVASVRLHESFGAKHRSIPDDPRPDDWHYFIEL